MYDDEIIMIPITLTPDLKVTDIKLLQYWKALSPIVRNLDGNVSDVIAVL
jgi:hypothetical protein